MLGHVKCKELCLANSKCSLNTSVLSIAILITNNDNVVTFGGEQKEKWDSKSRD